MSGSQNGYAAIVLTGIVDTQLVVQRVRLDFVLR